VHELESQLVMLAPLVASTAEVLRKLILPNMSGLAPAVSADVLVSGPCCPHLTQVLSLNGLLHLLFCFEKATTTLTPGTHELGCMLLVS
jgi:hypothetical protein